MEDRDPLLEHYRQKRDELEAAIDGLTDDEMSDPAIDGWSVKDHLAHMAFWHDLRAGEVARISAGHETAWPLTPEQTEALNELAYQARRGFSVAQARYELESARQRLFDAIEAASPRAFDPALYGEAGLRSPHEAEHAGWVRRWRESRP